MKGGDLKDERVKRNLGAGEGVHIAGNGVAGALPVCAVGVLLSALVSVAACEPVGWMQWVILAAVSIGQGYVLAAAAICLNQLIKQHGRAGALKKGFDGKEEEDETGN